MGQTREEAAGYVGCSTSTIRATARRDPEFAEMLAEAKRQRKLLRAPRIEATDAKGRRSRKPMSQEEWDARTKDPTDPLLYQTVWAYGILAIQLQDGMAKRKRERAAKKRAADSGHGPELAAGSEF
jgi:hypothetical protein